MNSGIVQSIAPVHVTDVVSCDCVGGLDDAALRAQLEVLHADSYGWALHCCGHRRHEAENVLQLVYLKVLSRKAIFGGRSGFKTWLFSVIRQTAAGERRTEFLRKVRLTALSSGRSAAAGPNSEGSATSNELQTELRKFLSWLPARQREVLQLVFYHDLSIVEAATVMGIGAGSARTHYERGKKQMRQWLATGRIE